LFQFNWFTEILIIAVFGAKRTGYNGKKEKKRMAKLYSEDL
jgi:hypothetical protein